MSPQLAAKLNGMPLPTRLTSPADLIAREAEKWMNLTVDLYDFDNPTDIPYDTATDTGGYSVPLLLLTSKARLQQLGAPKEATAGGEWVTKRAVRFQLPRATNTLLIRKGLIFRVQFTAENTWLSEYAFTVLSAINSGDPGVVTVECMSELAVVPRVA